jgi:hypothetical protein
MFLDDGENLDDGEMYAHTDMNNEEVYQEAEPPIQRGAATRQSYNGVQSKSTTDTDLQIQGIPVSNRQGNGQMVQKKAEKERGLKSKNIKETKEKMEKNDADFKQNIEGLSIVGVSKKK